MSDKIVVEFYGKNNLAQPVATVLAVYGGDNPMLAAINLKNFFDRIAKLERPRFGDAGLLAARFVAWEGLKSAGADPLDFIDVVLEEHGATHFYQTARVYALEARPYVPLVIDEHTACDELTDAAEVLRQYSVGPLDDLAD